MNVWEIEIGETLKQKCRSIKNYASAFINYVFIYKSKDREHLPQ